MSARAVTFVGSALVAILIGCGARTALDEAPALSDAGVLRCGDGVVEQGEACDDGNTVGGDTCSANCPAIH